MIRILFILASVTLLAMPVRAQQQPGSYNRLKDRIVWALAVEPGNTAHVLVGQKADKVGFGLVFKSLDGTASRRICRCH